MRNWCNGWRGEGGSWRGRLGGKVCALVLVASFAQSEAQGALRKEFNQESRGAPDVGAVAAQRRVLVVILDGVPWAAAQAAFARAGGAPAMPLVSSFPSTTHVAMPGLLGLPNGGSGSAAGSLPGSASSAAGAFRSPGYESRYFDWEAQRIRGGGPLSYQRMEIPWRSEVEWLGPGVWGNAVGALRPLADSRKRIRRALREFLASDEPIFVAHIGSADRLGHLRGLRAAEPLIDFLLDAVEAAQSQSPEPFSVVAYSDHGMSGGRPLHNVVKAVKQELRMAGLRPAKKLRNATDVVLTPFGLVSSFEVYAQPETLQQVARRLVELPAVQLCTLPEGADAWRVADAAGSARIERRWSGGTEWFRYAAISSDPLGLIGRIPLQDLLNSSDPEAPPAGVPGDSLPLSTPWFGADEWFDFSWESAFPDSIFRISRSFSSVSNRASLVCSLSEGFMFGAKKTERSGLWTIGPLRYTHGALSREASVGFLWTSCPMEQAAQRYESGPQRAIHSCLRGDENHPVAENGTTE